MAEEATHSGRPTLKIAARALGNVFLGIALGLAAYYLITDVFTRVQQRDLALGLPSAEAAVWSRDGNMDFSNWDEQDEAYWTKLPEGGPFGRLVAPDMNLDAIVVKGTSRTALMKGPGWITWTDLPGPTGNCGISGHRVTYQHPFYDIDQMKPGDIIRFYSPYRRYTYRVRETLVVEPDRVEVVQSTVKPTLTLTACHPKYSARFRYVVQSDLIEVRVLKK